MKKFIAIIALVLLIVLGVTYFNYTRHVAGTIQSGSVPLPWQPTQLQIPALSINAPVMSVGQTSSGEMDAPISQAYNSPYWTSVFWYNQGAAPGQPGNMVIAGHVNRVGGDPAVFWSLGQLQPGDIITVVSHDGSAFRYQVDRVVRYPASYPSQEAINAVFGPTSAHHLNLITCSGVWTGNGYDERLVVFTTQVG
jgi:hypothetical protein